MRTITKVVLPHHPLLGRNVNHDSMSRSYRIGARAAARAETLGEVAWPTTAPVLNQLDVGSCTGDAGVAAAYAAPTLPAPARQWKYLPDQDGAYRLYAAATGRDPYPGTWTYPPPGGQDTGSDGLSVAQELRDAGVCSGWLNAFSNAEALGALATSGEMTGVPWFNSMFDPAPDGLVTVDIASGLAGGHEFYVWRHRPQVGTSKARVGFRQSWGTSWGDGGEGWLYVEDWFTLLSMQGDVTQLVPALDPAPVPDPPVTDEKAAGDRLWSPRMRRWATARHVGENAWAAGRVRAWAQETGRP